MTWMGCKSVHLLFCRKEIKMGIRRKYITEDKLDKVISDVSYILDSLMLLRQLHQKGDCNVCKNRNCEYRPKPGQLVRYNCPGICLKETVKKRGEKGEKILDNFADLVNARVRKNTEERLFNDIRALYGLDDDVRIAIVRSDSLDGSVVVTDEEKECKPDNKYDSYKAFNSISARISISSSKANVNPFDVVDRLARNNHTPTDMATLLMAGKLNFDDIVSYIDDVINELKKKEDKK